MIEFLTTMSWAAVLQIIAIDILLGGDNAVVIALACRNLPPGQRTKGILWGTAGAIVLRVILVVFAVTMLQIPYLKIVGGVLLLWIGVKLLAPDGDDHHESIDGAGNLLSAIRTIIVADLVMSVDNVIAIAGAAHQADPEHQIGLVVFGLLVSIPIIVWGSQLVLRMIDRYPIVVSAGGALLGWIAGGMIVTDPATVDWLGAASPLVYYLCTTSGALAVVAIGKLLERRRAAGPRSPKTPAGR